MSDERIEAVCEVCDGTRYVACWSPGGPCPPEDRALGCETCGPCATCDPEAYAFHLDRLGIR